jgi:hypothetical protein
MASAGVFTDLYRERYAAVARDGAPLDALKLSYIKWGCANLPSGSAMPAPAASYGDIQAAGGAACPVPPGWPTPAGSEGTAPVGTRVGQNWYYTKPLALGTVSVVDNVLTVVCALDAAEANDDGTGGSPSLFELAAFDTAGNMMFYVTFDEVIKTSEKSLQRNVVVTL